MAEYTVKWQPVILVTDRRVACQCGALARFVTGKVLEGEDAPSHELEDGTVWCQACFAKAQMENYQQ